jgi:hypothetical protein
LASPSALPTHDQRKEDRDEILIFAAADGGEVLWKSSLMHPSIADDVASPLTATVTCVPPLANDHAIIGRFSSQDPALAADSEDEDETGTGTYGGGGGASEVWEDGSAQESSPGIDDSSAVDGAMESLSDIVDGGGFF